MTPAPIFDPHEVGRPMRVAGFMSGSGTNIRKLMERENELKSKEGVSPFELVVIFSDRSDGKCAGEKLALEQGIPYVSYDIRRFHQLRSVKRSVSTPEGLAVRKEYDRVPGSITKALEVDLIVLGGYMSYTTLNRCINVHPADLSIVGKDGRRKYVGDNAVYDAITSGEQSLCSSTLWVDQGVDTGPLLMVSKPLPVELPEPLDSLKKDKRKLLRVVEEHQERLKEVGDWEILPRSVELIARGRFALDQRGGVYLDGRPVPEGYRLPDS